MQPGYASEELGTALISRQCYISYAQGIRGIEPAFEIWVASMNCCCCVCEPELCPGIFEAKSEFDILTSDVAHVQIKSVKLSEQG